MTRLVAPPLAVLALTCPLLAIGCTADSTKALRTMGDWVASDAKAFRDDIAGAPAYASTEWSKQVHDLKGSTSWIVGQTARDWNESKAMAADAPGWVGRQFSADIAGLRSTGAQMGGWFNDNVNATRENIVGAPAFVSGHVQSQSKELVSTLDLWWGWFRESVGGFWGNMAEFFEMMIF